MRSWRRATEAGLTFALALLIVVQRPALLGSALTAQPVQETSSWALGVVVPQGAAVGSGTLDWENVSDLAVGFRVPELDSTDGTLLLVLSAETSGTVIQVATGLLPGERLWKAFAWVIPDADGFVLSYRWILNGSGPAMAPGDSVLLALSKGSGTWTYALDDLTTGENMTGGFGVPQNPLTRGDQEVFAVESYTSNSSVFSAMGDLAVGPVTVDGAAVTGGFYYMDGWEAVHHPLFVIGTEIAPGFIQTSSFTNGTVQFSFSEPWGAPGQYLAASIVPGVLVLLCASAALGAYAYMIARTSDSKKEPDEDGKKTEAGLLGPASD